MVAIDSAFVAPRDTRITTTHTGQFVLFAALCAALLAAASLAIAPEGAGWRTAAEMVTRFSLLVFGAAMVVEPLSRLMPLPATQALAKERGGLMLAFAIVSFMALGCMYAPARLSAEHLTAPAIAYMGLTSLVLMVLLFSSHPATIRVLTAPVWRSLQRIATAYFWLSFLLVGFDHLIGPHKPDGWYGFSVLFLVAILLIRFADAFVAHLLARNPTRQAA
ncbi:MAG: hypothetical protein JO167_07815 [Alphaproteobacteria bacterium]|nr:hypothetical protein [Alphaproteobacteria bacterium]MBV9903745.1 hypothetical protein [Alphaproteobacteria bacterium]